MNNKARSVYARAIGQVTNGKIIKKNRRLSFTLVEILVVIVIVAVLAGLLSSALKSVQETKIRVHCVNNLKQITQAVALYANDWSNELPVWDNYADGTPIPLVNSIHIWGNVNLLGYGSLAQHGYISKNTFYCKGMRKWIDTIPSGSNFTSAGFGITGMVASTPYCMRGYDGIESTKLPENRRALIADRYQKRDIPPVKNYNHDAIIVGVSDTSVIFINKEVIPWLFPNDYKFFAYASPLGTGYYISNGWGWLDQVIQ